MVERLVNVERVDKFLSNEIDEIQSISSETSFNTGIKLSVGKAVIVVCIRLWN